MPSTGAAGGISIFSSICCSIYGVEPGSSILDFGCGFGDLCGYFAERGIEVAYTGLDLSPELLNEARYRHPNATLFEGDLFDLPSILGE